MRVALALLVVVSCGGGQREGAALPTATPAMPVANPARGLEAVVKNASCEACHADIAEEWRASAHRRAFENQAFQHALAIEPLPFCRSCHAPEAEANVEPPAQLAALGVACVTCHLVGGDVLAAPRSSLQRETAPHPVVRNARFASPQACAACHEFPFPDQAFRRTPLLMQSTVSEHAASPFAGQSCADCHMPRVRGRRVHGFESTRDPEALRAAITVATSRVDGRRVRIDLRARGVGHAFPTGDLFRRVEVSAEAVGPDLFQVATASRQLTRHFDVTKSTALSRRELTLDDRLDAKTRQVVLDLGPAAAPFPVVWRVVYQRVAHPLVGDGEARIESEVELASGRLETVP